MTFNCYAVINALAYHRKFVRLLLLCCAAAGGMPPRPPQAAPNPQAVMGYPQPVPQPAPAGQQAPLRREATNDYAALFVALIGKPPLACICLVVTPKSRIHRTVLAGLRCSPPYLSSHSAHGMCLLAQVWSSHTTCYVLSAGESDSPQGVVNTSDGRVVRAFHRFTLVDQNRAGHDLTKGRRRDQGAVKISCARQVGCLTTGCSSLSSLTQDIFTFWQKLMWQRIGDAKQQAMKSWVLPI